MSSHTQADKAGLLLKPGKIPKAFIGFDGYVDLIQRPVKSGGHKQRSYFDLLADLGSHITASAGKSAQIELTTAVRKLGGNGPIMANAMAALGVNVCCAGTMGFPSLHEVFKDMHPHCQLISFGEPAFTNALEFNDGKLILSELGAFDNLDFPFIQERLGEKWADPVFEDSDLIALVDWTNLPLGTNLWSQIFKHMQALGLGRKQFFFDLCDPSKKKPQEITEVLELISRFGSIGRTVLGLNENEALKIFDALWLNNTLDDEKRPWPEFNLQQVAEFIFARLRVDALLVHPADHCILVTDAKTYLRPGRLVANPVLLTGGGDNLNAGFCFGMLHGMSWEFCMDFGMAVSGWYVEHGFSPELEHLVHHFAKEAVEG